MAGIAGKGLIRLLFSLVDLACDPTQHADLGAVIMHEGNWSFLLIKFSTNCGIPVIWKLA